MKKPLKINRKRWKMKRSKLTKPRKNKRKKLMKRKRKLESFRISKRKMISVKWQTTSQKKLNESNKRDLTRKPKKKKNRMNCNMQKMRRRK